MKWLWKKEEGKEQSGFIFCSHPKNVTKRPWRKRKIDFGIDFHSFLTIFGQVVTQARDKNKAYFLNLQTKSTLIPHRHTRARIWYKVVVVSIIIKLENEGKQKGDLIAIFSKEKRHNFLEELQLWKGKTDIRVCCCSLIDQFYYY